MARPPILRRQSSNCDSLQCISNRSPDSTAQDGTVKLTAVTQESLDEMTSKPLPEAPVASGNHPVRRLAPTSVQSEPRDIEDLLAERGVAVTFESSRCWCNKFGPYHAHRPRRGTFSHSSQYTRYTRL